ncbi:SLAM family member 6, partial [Camelus dromedarius]
SKEAFSVYDRIARMLTAVRAPAPVSTADSMIWLFHSLPLVFCLGPGNTVSQTSSSPLIVNRALGESVTFPLKFSAEENVTSITWLHNGISITFIQLNEKQSPLKYVTDPQRKNRLTVTDSYSLQLSNLTMADAGFYKAQKTTVSSSVLSTYDLRIFILNISLSDLLAFCIKVSLSSFEPASDARRANIVTDFGEIWFPKEGRLRNLQVVTHIERPSNVTCEIHLTCSVENPNDVIFRWQISGKTLLREANLTISWDPKNDSEETYTCIAENPVSNSSFSVPVQSLCKDVINEESEHMDIKWIIIVFSLICIVVIVIFVWLLVRKGRLTGFLSSYLSLLQGFFHLSTRQTQSPERYDYVLQGTEIRTPLKNSDSPTIYSKVHQHKEPKEVLVPTDLLYFSLFPVTGSPFTPCKPPFTMSYKLLKDLKRIQE